MATRRSAPAPVVPSRLLLVLLLVVAVAVVPSSLAVAFAILPPWRGGARSPHHRADVGTSTTMTTTTNDQPANDVDFPPPLTGIQRVQQAAQFWSSAIPIVLSYYSKDAELRVKEVFTGVPLTPDEEVLVWNEQHARGARKLADTITSLKGFYVKTA